MKIAMCQMAMSHSRKENLEKSLSALYEAAAAGAELILYPEIQLSRFFPQYPGRDASDMALAIDSEEVMAFRRACRETGIIAVPNFYLEEKGGCYDTSVFIGADGEIIGKQKMVHIAQAEQFYEQDYYAPSDEGFLVFDTPHGKIGAVICFDRHYPESIRTEALMGADLILIPTANTKAEPSEMFKWELRVQAFQNSVAVAMCNRAGREDAMHFSGESVAVDANGNIIALGGDKEEIIYAQIDLRQSAGIRNSRPYTQLRRPEHYI